MYADSIVMIDRKNYKEAVRLLCFCDYNAAAFCRAELSLAAAYAKGGRHKKAEEHSMLGRWHRGRIPDGQGLCYGLNPSDYDQFVTVRFR